MRGFSHPQVVCFLPHRHYGQIAHRDQARRGFPHAPDGIDRNGHSHNVAVRTLDLDLQVRLVQTNDLSDILAYFGPVNSRTANQL
ncbi:MAG: hypothetical protein V3W43_11420 [Desulfatiglandaceae bacterium]